MQIEAGKKRGRGDSDELNEIPVVRPDGDVELQDAGKGFVVPPCRSCGGFLKPNVVFFGDGIPKPRAARCANLHAEVHFTKKMSQAVTCFEWLRC